MANIKALKKLKAYILKHARQYKQEWWGYGPDSYYVRKTRCGTAACLAGSACVMEGWKLTDFELDGETSTVRKARRRRSISILAGRILGVSRACDLFKIQGIGWDPVNRKAYKNAKNATQRARAAAAELDLYIQGIKG